MFLFRETNFNFKGKVGKFSCSSGLPKGSHLYVACWSVCDPDQEIFRQQKVCLIAWLSLQKLLITHFLQVKGQIGATHFWSLDQLLKRVLIPVTNASTQDIQVTTPCQGMKLTLQGEHRARPQSFLWQVHQRAMNKSKQEVTYQPKMTVDQRRLPCHKAYPRLSQLSPAKYQGHPTLSLQ